ncbi:DUF2971 domain-containing protein [Pontibacter saemangeumensis]|uniref:DUF2971 domain-containing protein n=1 Tax=Pontibacter saemangeumensis TaxID=1084525 RepID=A0ABP8M040_9BACT
MAYNNDQHFERVKESFSRLGLLNSMIPTTHYHYTSAESALLILQGAKLRFSNPSSFNDPFDMDTSIINFDCDREAFINFLLRSRPHLDKVELESMYNRRVAINPKHFQDIASRTLIKYRENFGVACFSQDYKNYLLWSHYAKNHTGVCIGFRYNTFSGYLPMPVRYTKKKIFVNHFDRNVEPLIYLAYLKSSVWKYEKEIRAIYFNMREYPDNLIPFEKSCLLTLHFGIRVSEEDKDKIISALHINQYSNVKVFNMVANRSDYGFLKPNALF